MQGPKGCASTAKLLLLIMLALACLGCRPGDPEVVERWDPSLLSSPEEPKRLSFLVSFVTYASEEADLLEEAWALADPPQGEIDALWRENGLRIAAAAPPRARAVSKALKSAVTMRAAGHQMVLPLGRSFEVALAATEATTGLAYRTRNSTAYKDASGVRLGLKVLPIGRPPDAKVSISPLFATGGENPSKLVLDDLSAVFPACEGAIVLVGPVRRPTPLRLGGLLIDNLDEGTRCSLVLIEARPSK